MSRKARTPAPEAEATPPVAPAEPKFFTLPLFSLVLSELNVRHTERDADIAALAEDIAAIGLLQPLLVVPAHFSTAEVAEGENYGDRFEVIGGGRRVQALKLLAEAGRLPHDHPVPVTVRHRDDARTVSLSENLHRVAMNPADEFEAFAAIVAQNVHAGQTAESATAACAKRFGVTVKQVAGRLRLATLHSDILEALRTGTITLDTAKAYAGTEDQNLQVSVFRKRKLEWQVNDPKGIRQELRQVTVPLTHHFVTFVGLQAYRDAGGRTEVEMFMGTDGEERLVNVDLLEKLVRAQAEELIPERAKADGYLRGFYSAGYNVDPPEAGFVRAYDYGQDVTKKDRKVSIAAYHVDQTGELSVNLRFKPKEEKQEAPGDRIDWAARRAAEEREEAIAYRSAFLALRPEIAIEDATRFVIPEYLYEGVMEDDDDPESLICTVHIRMPRAAAQAHVEEATRLIDAEIAAAKAAEQETRDAEADEEAEEDAAMDDDEVEA